MSPRIHLLPDELITRIAAGEVVERPASIIKELVENSLDAGADHIVIGFEGAGRTRITVSDNGCGMTVGEALLSLQRHATSKISSFEDLESVSSFGFRGEALPSIAAVSRFRMVTRSADEELGWEILVEGGKIQSEKPVAREPGTTIEIKDIFFNTPARYKFLKSDVTERSQMLRIIEEMMFSFPNVTFELVNEKAKPAVFRKLPGDSIPEKVEALRTRISEVWGPRWSRGLQAVHSKSPHFGVFGLVTNQGFHQATPRTQFLYVNQRPVANRRLSRAVYDAYLGQLPSLRHPGWTLFLSVDPKNVDVNVHPSKREVKLTHEGEIFSFLSAAVKQALKGTQEAPVEVFSSIGQKSRFMAESAPVTERSPSFSKPTSAASSMVARETELKNLYQPSSLFSEENRVFSAENQETPELVELRDAQLQVVAQVRQTYIVAHTEKGILLIDQHAAAEKASYERLMANLLSTEPQVQMLLVPFTWEVAMSVTPLVGENLSTFSKMGFVMEPFGGNTFLLKGVPAHLGERFDLHSLLDGLSDVLTEASPAGSAKGGWEKGLAHRIAAMTACKTSVKAGDALDLKECRFIAHQLAQLEAPFTCPHGRPTVIRLPYSDLERRFRRA